MVRAISSAAVGPGLPDVIAADRDRVPGRQFGAAVGEQVGDQAHRGTGRVDVGAPGGVLLEDVVLHGPPDAVRRRPPAPRRRSGRAAAGSPAVALMVIEVETSPSGMPASSRRMSSSESIATPTLPTSPAARGSSESRPIWVGRSKATDSPVWPAASSARNRSLVLVGGAETCVLAHRPQPTPVHGRVGTAGERDRTPVRRGARPHPSRRDRPAP